MTTTEPTVKDEPPQRRECLLCGRDCAIIRQIGPLTIKESCPNKCGAGYAKPAPLERQERAMGKETCWSWHPREAHDAGARHQIPGPWCDCCFDFPFDVVNEPAKVEES